MRGRAGIIPAMTERGLPIVDGAPACPFVAFEDDRDERATSPDHRHRCYAEIRPAPRALAHQEAYCLSSAFPVCPTFQDWARREAARARRDEPGVGDAASAASAAAAAAESGGRNAPRDWTAPPPWAPESSSGGERRDGLAGERDDLDDDDAEVAPIPARGGGLSGSFADRMLGRAPADDRPDEESDAGRAAVVVPPIAAAARQEPRPSPTGDEDVDDDGYDDGDEDRPTRGRRPVGARPRRELQAPAWERPRRLEAYPTIRERRMPGSSIGGQPVILGAIAILIAAVALFFLPSLLPIGSPGATPTPSPGATSGASAAASGAALATPTPGPTDHVYVVQAGDTMSRIAARFGVPLQTLIDANKTTIPNPDALQIGDKVTIPAPAATTIPNAFTPAPSK